MHRHCSLLFALLALGAPAVLHAQGEAGLKAGVSFGNISNKGLLPGNLDTRTGFAGGLYLGYRVGFVGVGLEGLYAQRGAKSDQSFATAQTRLDYIDVPAYVKVALPTPLVQPFAYAGPQVSFEVRCHEANDAACPDAATSGRKKTDYGAVFGAGVRFGGLGLEGRYVYGLRDLKLNTVTDTQSYKTRTFLILVSIGRS
jgi:Outer membrane protein beta-barrel domain